MAGNTLRVVALGESREAVVDIIGEWICHEEVDD
jgi:hypothetical protein